MRKEAARGYREHSELYVKSETHCDLASYKRS
jgi:hypothetical protein